MFTRLVCSAVTSKQRHQCDLGRAASPFRAQSVLRHRDSVHRVIDSRGFRGDDQIRITLASHNRKYVERKIFDDPNGAFAFAEIGEA